MCRYHTASLLEFEILEISRDLSHNLYFLSHPYTILTKERHSLSILTSSRRLEFVIEGLCATLAPGVLRRTLVDKRRRASAKDGIFYKCTHYNIQNPPWKIWIKIARFDKAVTSSYASSVFVSLFPSVRCIYLKIIEFKQLIWWHNRYLLHNNFRILVLCLRIIIELTP